VKEFVTEAKKDFGKVNKDSAITFKHDGREVTFYEPSTGQFAIMLSLQAAKMDARTAGTFIQLFFEMMDEPTQRYFQGRLLDSKDPFELDGKAGIVEIFEELTREWSGKAGKKPSDFQSKRQATGKSSTAPVRVRASTSSRTRSRAS
jgi:hypothetical protein